MYVGLSPLSRATRHVGHHIGVLTYITILTVLPLEGLTLDILNEHFFRGTVLCDLEEL